MIFHFEKGDKMTASLVFFVMTVVIGIPFVVMCWIADALEDSYQEQK